MAPQHSYYGWDLILSNGALAYGALAIGGSVVVAVLVRSWILRFAGSTVLGWLGFLLFVAQRHEESISGHHRWDLVGVTLAMLLLSVAMTGWFCIPGPFGRGVQAWLRRHLTPLHWRGQAADSEHDRITRLFVGVTAGTASATFYQMSARPFWLAVAHAVSPLRLIYTIVLIAVPLVLIGPIEEYVIGIGANDGETAHPKHELAVERFSKNISWRSFGRLSLVLVLLFALSVLHESLDETLSQSTLTAASIISVGIISGILGFYWSAAVLNKDAHVGRQTAAAVSIAVSIFGFPALWLLLLGRSILGASGHVHFLSFLSPAEPALTALSMSQILTCTYKSFLTAVAECTIIAGLVGGQAWLGVFVLKHRGFSQRLPLMLFALGVIILVPQMLLVAPFGRDLIQAIAISILTAAGTVVGLLFSGFPAILTRLEKNPPVGDAEAS